KRKDGSDVFQRFDQDVGVGLSKFVGFGVARGDSDAQSADRAAAGDIVLRVADDNDSPAGFLAIFGTAIRAQRDVLMRGGQSGSSDIVAVEVIVAVAAEGEGVPEIVVDELSFCSFADIAREKAEGNIVAGRQCTHEAASAGKDESLMRMQGS